MQVMFVCHGNICRSPMAEFVFRDLVKREGLSEQISVVSAATSTEEVGNPVHHGTQKKLAQYGISVAGKYSVQLKKVDYAASEYILVMDQRNLGNITKIIGDDPQGKVHLLLEFANRPGQEIADPWYTGNFDVTYEDILAGCQGLLAHIRKHHAM